MTVSEFWLAVLIGSLAVYSWKLLGYLFPKKLAESPEVGRFATSLTIALLSALTAVQAFSTNREVTIDSRLLALAVAAIMFWRKLPFIVVVATAAGVAAGARYFLGWL